MEESLGLGKKSSGAETDTETWSWFRLPIPKPGFGRTLVLAGVLWSQILKLQIKNKHWYSYSIIHMIQDIPLLLQLSHTN